MYRAFAVWEVCREDEFSPLKNGTGTKDTAETCRRDLILQHIRYLRKAGAEFRYEFSFNKKNVHAEFLFLVIMLKTFVKFLHLFPTPEK